MKPITNILLIAAIICYVFLPFRTMDLSGSITGLSYSAGLISENFSLLKTIFALLPFIACFGGVALNSNKHRYWSFVTVLAIAAGIAFFCATGFLFQSWELSHDPELVGDPASQIEGFKVKELNIGYYASHTLMWLSLISCIISFFPFKFNQRLERTIDDGFERGVSKGKESLSKVQKELHNEISQLETKAKQKQQTPPAEQKPEDPEDPSRFMPKQ